MVLHQPQKTILSNTARFRVLCCGRRFGKTTLAIEEMKCLGLARPSRIAYIAPTYQQARDIAWEELKKQFAGLEPTINESRLEIRFRTIDGKGESIIMLRGWEAVETLRGQFFDLLVLDEVAMMRDFWAMWREVLRPTLTDRKGQGMFISTPKGYNHFHELYLMENEHSDWKSFKFTSYDNPHIPAEEIDAAKDELTPDSFAQEYMADFRKMEGIVYKEFMRERHVYNTATINAVETLAGLDFGYNHPAACLTVKVDHDGVYWVTDEYYETGKTHAQIAEYVAANEFNKVYPDPAAPEAIKELTDRGVNCIDVVKGADSVKNGIQKVRDLFKQGRIKIHKDCVNLIWELETYHYDPNLKDKDKPVKEQDDAVDALRYLVMTHVPGTNNNPYKQARVITKRLRAGKNLAT